MSVAAHALLTYEQYLAEEVTSQRYDIVDGVRNLMNPTQLHQEILGNIYVLLRVYGKATGLGKALIAPRDVLVRRNPLRVRQPDVLFISYGRLAQSSADTDPSPLLVAPELVVEILSPTETQRILEGKIADYCAIGVEECWVVDPVAETVEVLRLTREGAQSVAVYSSDATFSSLVFSGLNVSVATVFES